MPKGCKTLLNKISRKPLKQKPAMSLTTRGHERLVSGYYITKLKLVEFEF